VDSGQSLLAFMTVAAGVAAVMFVGYWIARVRATKPDTLQRTTYECGEADTGVTWIRFHARYYVVALFFVLFDVEAAFLYPWALVVRELGTTGLAAIGSFVGILMLGWLWARKKGALQWQ
jgi:NADH-quinone oxidoreductase subunit A